MHKHSPAKTQSNPVSKSEKKASKMREYTQIGKNFFRDDLDKSIECFKQAAKLGSVEDYYNVGYCLNQKYKRSINLPEEERKSIRTQSKTYYASAAKELHIGALVNYGILCLEDGDIQIAVNCFKLAADKGNLNGMLNYANAMKEVNKEESMKYFKLAADHCEHDEAMIYADQIVYSNEEESITYYKIALAHQTYSASEKLGQIMEEKGLLQEAIDYYKIFLFQCPEENPDGIRYRIGKAYYQLYQNTESQKYKNRYLKQSYQYLKMISQKDEQVVYLLQTLGNIDKTLVPTPKLNAMMPPAMFDSNHAIPLPTDIAYHSQSQSAKSALPTDEKGKYIISNDTIPLIIDEAKAGNGKAAFQYANYLLKWNRVNEIVQGKIETSLQDNFNEACQYYKMAYENGIQEAGIILGLIQMNNWNEESNDPEQIIKMFELNSTNQFSQYLLEEMRTKKAPYRVGSRYSVFA